MTAVRWWATAAQLEERHTVRADLVPKTWIVAGRMHRPASAGRKTRAGVVGRRPCPSSNHAASRVFRFVFPAASARLPSRRRRSSPVRSPAAYCARPLSSSVLSLIQSSSSLSRDLPSRGSSHHPFPTWERINRIPGGSRRVDLPSSHRSGQRTVARGMFDCVAGGEAVSG
jgi:hypothetical protein